MSEESNNGDERLSLHDDDNNNNKDMSGYENEKNDDCESSASTSCDNELYTNDRNEDFFFDNGSINNQLLDNKIIFKESNSSVWDVLLMIQALYLKFSFCMEAAYAIFKMMLLLAGPKFCNWRFSKYSFFKYFNYA